jgi:hypothetical protein
MLDKPVVEGSFLVEKRIAASGFKMSDLTFVLIPNFPPVRPTGKGSFRVKGLIDSYELKQYNLLPGQNNSMILPINAAVRKKIGKQVGDYVEVTLFADESQLILPEYFAISLMDSPKAQQFFDNLTEANKKYYIQWVDAAQKMETKVERMLKVIEKLEKGIRFYDW